MGLDYEGFVLLKPIADNYGIELYQLNFIFLQVCAILVGFFFKKFLKASAENALKRHVFNIVFGMLFGYLCYGPKIVHVVFESIGSYLILMIAPKKYSYIIVLVFSMAYLSVTHLYAQFYSQKIQRLDITSQMMIATQKLTSLAFAFYDGSKPIDSLNEDQKSQLITDLPTFIEFSSYMFNFQGIIVGPLCFYHDYIEFINGRNFLKYKKSGKKEPDCYIPVLKKVVLTAILIVAYMYLSTSYSFEKNIEEEIVSQPIWYRIWFLYFSLLVRRQKYCLAWILGDAVNNASGLGFNGYDSKGRAKWDLVTNINTFKLETSTSIKKIVENWNIQTQLWLRRIAYDRLPVGKTLAVFVLSAFWHGFFPGYYLSFVQIAFLVYAGRGIRRKIRPFFVGNKTKKICYSFITWAGSFFSISYATCPFELNDLDRGIRFFNDWYWFAHIMCILIIFILPVGSSKKKC